ncbi:uncharacterized protein LOC105200819 [Solenopsis invicta]|uniref:uncharacterized protein LOC105200819 n=1 Tax=Solenopsis invicta TaxID=13686 RepID=UPI00193CDADB|nr:uncharacterized protein LOC105200819 [Solenopsis invicta]
MSRIEDFQKWLDEVMSTIIENLGSNVNEARYELCRFIDYPMSTQYYINIKFKNKNGDSDERDSDELAIMLKRPTLLETNRLLNLVDYQFHNEILFYQTYAQPGENFAKCFYANERPPIDSVIALENVNKRQYCPCPYTYDAPLEYTLAAFREMGRFHGKGYAMKELQRDKFFDIVKQIQECRYDKRRYNCKNFIDIIATRAVDYLRNHGHDVTFCDKMEALFSKAYDNVIMKAVEPREPLSTLCHGDFTLSNTLFKTDNGGHRAMLIDFALCRYSTPVVDLSSYLCLCCSNEVRKDKFFEIMRVYHDALKEYLLEAGVSNIEKYSYEALLDDFRRGGLFGFILASFYLAVLKKHGDRTDKDSHQVSSKIFNVKSGEFLKQYGGDKISKILADMLLQLNDFGCLKYF